MTSYGMGYWFGHVLVYGLIAAGLLGWGGRALALLLRGATALLRVIRR